MTATDPRVSEAARTLRAAGTRPEPPAGTRPEPPAWTGPDLLDVLAEHDTPAAPALPAPPAAPRQAVARSTDPGTSWAAARSVKVRESQTAVLGLLRALGPSTDERLVRSAPAHGVKLSPSGIRSRRSELVDLGLVRDSLERVRLESGRHAVVWEAVPS